MEKKAIVMLSGGLDSRLALKIMQEQGFKITTLFFKFPFGTGCCDEDCSFNFSQLQRVKLKILDYTKGKALQEYLKTIKDARYGRGKGINPCIDCRIFMFKKAKEFADMEKIDLIVTGEVVGERPMSQTKNAMSLIEEKSELKGRLLRPLSAKLLPETEAEKKGLVDREKLYEIHGRKRGKQMALAKMFDISYPTPAGGCLLCEKSLAQRFKKLLGRELNDNEIKLIEIGRHFMIPKNKEVSDNNCWIVIGRNEKENNIIEFLGKDYDLITPDFIGPTAVIIDKCGKEVKEKVKELIKAYSKQGNLKDRKKFERYKL